MLGFAGDRLGAKRKGRRVEELYYATEIIDEAEITPVLRGNCRMRGPVEETDVDNRKNMVTPQAERRLGKHSMSRRNRMRAESGTCNVCSAPCSSCMHLNLALMGSKTDEVSDETCRETTGSQYSINGGDVSSKGRPCDSLQHTASEASNLLSVNSSLDSFSVNAESKATVRSSDISDASEDFEMQPKLSSSGLGAEDQLSPKPESVLDLRISLNKYDDPKGVEGHDDNISCVCRDNDANTAVSDHDRSVDIKNLSHSSASVCSLGPDGLGTAPSSLKLELTEIPSLKKVDAIGGSPVVRSLVTHSRVDNYLIEGSSGALIKVNPKSETETDRDSGEPPDETFKCSVQDKQGLKSTQLAELPDVLPLQAASSDETDESDAVEHDVKVCDICGDAGREDLLAICSRCSDGAEHTYCMREMLQKIPEGDWLCEECKFAEETEKQKQELYFKGVDLEGKRTNKISTSTQSTGKRHAENPESAPAAKRQAIETSLGSPKSLSPGRTATLSRDSSFKSLDKGKVRPASFGNHSSNDVTETTRSPSGLVPQTRKGHLLKSSSFNTLNSKAKVKMVDEVVSQKQKGTREQVSLDIREGLTRVMGKSMSFRSTNSGHPSAGESKLRMLSPRSSHVHDLKGLKPVKERNAFGRNNLSRLDRPLPGSPMTTAAVSTPKVDQKLTPRGETISLSSASNNRESKVVKAEGKGSTLSKSNSNLARKGLEVPVTPVGALSTTGMGSSVEQKPNLVIPNDEPSSSSSWTAEKPSTNVNEILQDGLPCSMESTDQGEKTSSSHPRPITTGSKGVLCQKCKEIGHDVESCPLGSPQLSGVDASAGRNSREDMIRGNKLKAAIEAAMHKLHVTFGRNRVNDQSDGFCVTNMDLNCERAFQDQLSVSNKMKGIHETQTNKQTTMSLKPFSDHSTDVVFPVRARDSISVVPSLGKAATRDWPGHALAETSAFLKTLAIPELEYIWQGGFEVHRGPKIPDLCSGIQAHLSSCASPKVLEMMNKFPQRIQLNEVPRLSTWPTMFHESGAKEDNIALYFFAKDHESYERNYKCLVDSMIKNDLALKGNLDGVELLIFPSNQLPENRQRWNLFFFLWGVFRVRKASCSNSSKNSCIAGWNMVPLDRVISTDNMSLSQNLCLPKHTDKDSAACDSSQNIAPGSYSPEKISVAINGNCDDKVSSVQQTSMGSQPNSEQQDGRLDSKFASRATASISPLSTEMRCASPSWEERNLSECGLVTEVKPSLRAIRTIVGSSKGGMTEVNGGASLREDSSSLKEVKPFLQTIGTLVSSSKDGMAEMNGGASHAENSSSLKEVKSSLQTIGTIISSSKDGMTEMNGGASLGEDSSLLKNLPVENEGLGDKGGVNTEKVTRILESGREEINLERDLNDECYMETETALERNLNLNHHQQSNHLKCQHLDLTETAEENSCDTIRKMPWNEAFVDGESSSKKLKTGFAEAYDCSSYRDRDSYRDGVSSRIDDLGSSSVEKRCDKLSDKKVIPKELGSTERYFFPVDSRLVKDFRLGANSMLWKDLSSKDEGQLVDVVPNLELALGAETKQPNKGMLPFFVGPVDKNNQEKLPEKEVEEDASASLSLSLSFPFPDKEQTSVKPASKTEQLLPERRHVNTSLLLFGGFLDK